MTSVIPRTRASLPYEPALAGWLLLCAALVLLIVVVGGFTRLTHSGLSIVEWAPVTGVVPPLTEAQWQDAIEQYRRTPEYQKVNRGMSLEAFKGIYWVEWAHRLLGRLVGVVFLLPAVCWWTRGRVPRSLAPRLAGLFALGGLQGAVGWAWSPAGSWTCRG